MFLLSNEDTSLLTKLAAFVHKCFKTRSSYLDALRNYVDVCLYFNSYYIDFGILAKSDVTNVTLWNEYKFLLEIYFKKTAKYNEIIEMRG